MAYDFISNNIYYKITGANTCKVTYASLSYNSYSGNIVIPSTVTNVSTTYTVTEIDSGAFALCTSLGSVTLPNTIVKIDSSAFVASSLTSINIPMSVRYIGSAAFGMTDITTKAFLMRWRKAVMPNNSVKTAVFWVLISLSFINPAKRGIISEFHLFSIITYKTFFYCSKCRF